MIEYYTHMEKNSENTHVKNNSIYYNKKLWQFIQLNPDTLKKK